MRTIIKGRKHLWWGAVAGTMLALSPGLKSLWALNETYIVTSTADTADATPGDGICGVSGGDCTLRAAIQETNARPGADTIVFRIPGTGVKTIIPNFPGLPPITDPVTIDGYTQPGSSVNTLAVGDNAVINIEISGDLAINGADALDIRDGGSGSLVRGLVINGFQGNSVQMLGNNIAVEGCFLGTNAAGTAASRNDFGVDIGYGLGAPSGNCRIGGSTPAQRNIIADSIFLSSPLANTIQGNYIGTDKTGNVALNIGVGIVCSNLGGGPDIAGAIIGGPTTIPGRGAGNVISGNAVGGIRLTASAVKIGAFTIQGNIIGLNAAGTTALPNAGSGILVEDANVTGATGSEQSSLGPVTIGGTVAGARNIISGNAGAAITALANNLTVQGNYIGTDISGTLDRGNLGGISLNGSATGASSANGRSGSALIGGATAAARNVISGNDGGAIFASATTATIQGNFIGTTVDGTTPLGNSGNAITVNSNTRVLLGGADAGEGNTIAFSSADGIVFRGATMGEVRGNAILSNANRGLVMEGTSTIPILGNTFFNNGTDAGGNPTLSLPIDLVGGAGITPNDAGDADTGPNDLQNFPIVTGTAGNVVSATLNSKRLTQFRIEFFANDAADFSGAGEGQRFLGFKNVTTNGAGNAAFTFTAPSSIAGQFISATATDPAGNTSEFSASRAVGAPSPGTVQFSAASYSINEGVATATITVTRSGDTTGAATVAFATSNGTATANSDYSANADTLSFAAGETSKTFGVGIINDSLDEPNETINLTLSSPTGATLGTQSTSVLTIIDNDATALPTLSIRDVQIGEGDSGTRNATFTVSLSAASATPITVRYATSNGTATAGNDYQSTLGTLSFAANGSRTQTISVLVRGDRLVEANETFFVDLSNSIGATLADGRGVGTILDDDVPVTLVLAISDARIVEGNSGTRNAVFTVTRPRVPAPLPGLNGSANRPKPRAFGDVTVRFTTSDGTAQAPVDYEATSGTLSFAPNELTKTINVPIVGDTIIEPNETFFVDLSNATGARIEDGRGVGTIVNDDGATTPSANLSVEQSDSLDPAVVGQDLTYTLTIRNNGPSAATNVQLQNVLPSNATFISATPVAQTQSGRTLTFNLGTLANGDTRTIAITVRPTGGALQNTATVSSTVSDPVTANNSSTEPTAVSAPPVGTPNIVVSAGSLARLPYLPGVFGATGRFRQRVTLRNTGNAPALGPISLVLDNLSSGVVLRNASGLTNLSTPAGNPFINVDVGADNRLDVGESATVVLEFLSRRSAIVFTPRVLSGGDAR